jgi:hypothetical protein
MTISPQRVLVRVRRGRAAAVLCFAMVPMAARAEDGSPVPERPAILFNRWQEDWFVLADPRLPRQPFDEF